MRCFPLCGHVRLILSLADGLTWAEIRSKLDCSDSYIDRWSKRLTRDRLAGLLARHTSAEFVAFLIDIVANQPNGEKIHVRA